jgi:transcriptional regulator with XRE-family HTH domain
MEHRRTADGPPRLYRIHQDPPEVEGPTMRPEDALGGFVRECREALGLTQEEASRAAGISKTTWQQLEWGEGARTRNLTLHKVARALHVAPAVLLDLREGVVDLAHARTQGRSRADVIEAILREFEWLRLSDLLAVEDHVQVRAELRRRQRAST